MADTETTFNHDLPSDSLTTEHLRRTFTTPHPKEQEEKQVTGTPDTSGEREPSGNPGSERNIP